MRSSNVSMRFSTQTLLLQLGVVLLVVLLSGAVHAWLVYDRIGTEARTKPLRSPGPSPPTPMYGPTSRTSARRKAPLPRRSFCRDRSKPQPKRPGSVPAPCLW